MILVLLVFVIIDVWNPEKFVEIYSGQLLSNARCWNGPALVNGYLIARNGQEMACFDWAKLK